jgi:flagellar basal-body rod protein FlgF
VTSGNAIVATEGGTLTIAPTDGMIGIAPDGTVSGKTGTLGKIRIVDFESPEKLIQEGATLYSSDQSAKPGTGKIQQGAIESSNVEPVTEIAHMIEVMRAYEAAAGLMKSLQGEPGEWRGWRPRPKNSTSQLPPRCPCNNFWCQCLG